MRRRLGILGILDGRKSCPRRHIEAEYFAVLRFEDRIDVDITAERVGASRSLGAWEIHRGTDLCVRGRHVVVHVDGHGHPAPLPETVQTALTA